jgi:hypothetical protein
MSEAVECGRVLSNTAHRRDSHQRLRFDNRNDLRDRQKPSIHLDEEPALVVGKLGSALHLAPQDDPLMSFSVSNRLFNLKRRGQHGQTKTDQRCHCANLVDPVT